jgi:sulfatase maturation enzyme AslB (radical SAM superfamily)
VTIKTHCPIIHGGLAIDLKKSQTQVYANHCCIKPGELEVVDPSNIWASPTLIPLRELNKTNTWSNSCWPCRGNEEAGLTSFRTGMLEKFGARTNLSGPQRLDLMFDIGCNLACRTCGPELSTFWQKHLKDNSVKFAAPAAESRVDEMISILSKLDLSNLEMVVFCGGETLMGQGYWRVAEAIASMVPDAKDKVTLSFQTNGTQTINERNYATIAKFQLVKLNISLDGVGERFEYLRWPAKWDQVAANILHMKSCLPVNVMFLIEETISVFNLFYQSELDAWAKENFSTNRLGDIVNHTRHTAIGTYGLHNLSTEYVSALPSNLKKLVNPNWVENTNSITKMLLEVEQFDRFRNQSWKKTFPELAEFYKRFPTSGM